MDNGTKDSARNGGQLTPALYHMMLILSLCVIVFGIVANFFIIVSFCKVKLLRTVTNYFIVNLAVADIFLLVSLTIWVSFHVAEIVVNEEQNRMIRNVIVSIEVFSSSASLTSLACVSVDRCLAITVPLRYLSITTPSRALVVVLTVWSYSIVTFITSYFRDLADLDEYNRVYISCLFCFTFALPMSITIWSYYLIFRVVWRQVHHAHEQTTPSRRFRKIMKEFRVAINILVTIVPASLLWGSFWVATLKEAFLDDRRDYSVVVDWLLGNTPHFAATINPLIYISMTRDFRLLCLRVLSCQKGREEFSLVVDSTSSNRQRSFSMRSGSTAQSVPLVDNTSSGEVSRSLANSEDSKSGNERLSAESSFVTSSTPEQRKDFVWV